MAVDKPLFAGNWYQPPHPDELRVEVMNLYDLSAAREADITDLRNDLEVLDASLDDRYLSLTGGTLTGQLNIQGSDIPRMDLIRDTADPGNRRWGVMVIGTAGDFTIRPRTDNGDFIHDGLILRRDGRARFRFSSGHLAEIYSITATGFEGSYAQATFLRGLLFVEDTRDVNDPPSAYRRAISFEFKDRAVVGVPGSGSFCGVMTFKPWQTTFGGRVFQLAFGESGVYARRSSSDHASWLSWITLGTF